MRALGVDTAISIEERQFDVRIDANRGEELLRRADQRVLLFGVSGTALRFEQLAERDGVFRQRTLLGPVAPAGGARVRRCKTQYKCGKSRV